MTRLFVKNKKLLRSTVFTTLVIVIAELFRSIAHSTDIGFVEQLLNLLLISLYIGLFSVWGISVHRRIIQFQVRRYFVSVAALMVLWLIIREFRWHLVHNATLRQFLWYAYYIPILLILLLGFLISLSLGKSDKYRLPKWTVFLFVPTLLLIFFVMTNNLHQLVFILPKKNISSKSDYHYGIVYYTLAVWVGLCALASFITLIVKCRIPRTKKFLWLPLLPVLIAVLYTLVYVSRIPVSGGLWDDVTVFHCLVFMTFFESCIQCGLIQSNTRYFNLFHASVEISAQVTDNNYNVCYTARDTVAITQEEMISAELDPVILSGGRRLHNMKIRGGHAIWTEDISELLELQEALAETRSELEEHNEFLQTEYEQEKEYRRVMEQNRLYDLLQKQTQSQLDQVSSLTDEYEKARDNMEKRRILSKIVILGSYIKRKKDFVLLMESTSAIPENRLKSALDESFRSLKLGGVQGGYIVETGCKTLNGDILMLAYDFFESVLETLLDAVRYIAVRVVRVNEEIRCIVTVDYYTEDISELVHKYPNMRIIRDEDGSTEYTLSLVGGKIL